MKAITKQAVIIGGGPAGLAAAVELHKQGIRDIAVLERESHPGGILRQCIHDGFGLTRFKQTLSGPEYAERFIDEAITRGIQIITDTTVLDITPNREVVTVSRGGMNRYLAGAVILAMGCRERTRGALSIPGTRPAGVFTAGVAQAYVNLKNLMVGKRVVILGSGDIGMIMARRLTLEGAKVLGVYEILPYPSGLGRNIEQCLNDYNIPLYLNHTVIDIKGKTRLETVTVSQVDESMRPIPGTEQEIECDTLILSVGLIPENELSLRAGVVLDGRTRGAVVDENFMTATPGIFAAGNVLHVHDLVDFVSLEAESLAAAVARYLSGERCACPIPVETGEQINYALPQRISGNRDVAFSLRVKMPLRDCAIEVRQSDAVLARKTLRKAIPAEMERIEVKAEHILNESPLKVVITS